MSQQSEASDCMSGSEAEAEYSSDDLHMVCIIIAYADICADVFSILYVHARASLILVLNVHRSHQRSPVLRCLQPMRLGQSHRG